MKLQLGHNECDQKSAEEYRRLADEHAQTLKDFWKRFVVSGLFVLALAIIFFASLAWFAANNSVNGASSTISAKAARYSIDGASGDGAKVGVYDSKADFGTLDSLNVSATYNLNNYSGGSLRPGSYGELKVTVTPVAQDVRNITLTLERNVQRRESPDSSVSDETLQNLFRGHVLFFKNRDANGYYSDPLLVDYLTIDSSKFCKDDSKLTTEPVTFTLYWVWPSQFSSYVLTGKLNYNQNLFESTSATGYSELLAKINAYGGWFFSSDATTAIPTVFSGMSSADLETCAEAYNAGDELLGTNAEYLQIRFVGEEASQ